MNILIKIIVPIFFLLFNGYSKAQVVAPDFTLTDSHGVTRNLYTELNAGKTVVLDFFITNCGTCQINTALLESVWQTYGFFGDSIWVWGIEMSGVSDSAVNVFQSQYNATYPAFSTQFDDNMEGAFNITYTPQYFVVCPAGYMKQVPVESIEQNIIDCPETTGGIDNHFKYNKNKKWFSNDNNVISFFFSDKCIPYKIDVFSGTGIIIKTSMLGNSSDVFHIVDLMPGVYFITAKSNNGTILKGKFIKW